MTSTPPNEFLALLTTSLQDGSFVKLTLGKPRGSDATLRNVFVRTVRIGGQARLSLVWHHDRRDLTKNHPVPEGIKLIGRLLGQEFHSAHLFTASRTAQLEFNKKGEPRLTFAPAAAEVPDTAHDREKSRLLPDESQSRTNVIPPRYSPDEVALVRQIRVPDTRTFGARGAVRIATDAPDDVLDSVLGLPDAAHGGLTVRASIHLPGDVAARGSAAFDGNVATAWNTGFATPEGQWVEFDTPNPVTLDHLDLQIVADGRHSVPTQLRIDAGAESRTIDLPAITASKQQNATVSVPVNFAPMTVSSARITITQVRTKFTKDYYCECNLAMPAAIAEFGIPGVQRAPLPAQLPSACRTDLLSVDDHAVGVRMTGSAADAESRQAIDLQLCNPQDAGAAPTLPLTAGDHVVRSQPGKVTGIDFDRFLLGSDAGGSAMTLGARGSLSDALQASDSAQATTTPTVRVTHDGATKITLQVSGAKPGTPFWLVLGESQNDGWEATVAGASRGSSSLVDGYANGWLVNPGSTRFSVTLDWTPQREVWIAIAISAAAILLCLFLALRGSRTSENRAGRWCSELRRRRPRR